MSHLPHLAAINAIIDATSTRRRVSIDVDKADRFCVELEPTRDLKSRYVVAPQLCHALSALSYLDDGEQLLLDQDGNPLCQTCEAAFCVCPECGDGSGDPKVLPARWPKQGLRHAILEKYAT